MATYQVNGAAVTSTSTRNNGGAAANIGGHSSLLDTVGIANAPYGVYGSKVVENLNGVTKAVAAGAFGTMVAGEYIMRGVTTTLAGVANTTLLSTGSDYGIRRSIHKREVFRTYKVATAIRAGYWDEYNGVWTVEPTVADDTAAIGVDHAAAPTLALPGELVYRDGSTTVVMDDYKPKTD